MRVHRLPGAVERARAALERAAHRCKRAQERAEAAQAELRRAHDAHMEAIAEVAEAMDQGDGRGAMG